MDNLDKVIDFLEKFDLPEPESKEEVLSLVAGFVAGLNEITR